MSDEECGRLWAAQNGGATPGKMSSTKWLWYRSEDNGYKHFHGALTVCLDHDFYPSEGEAYAALWRAVQEVRREVPDLRKE